MKLCFVGSGYVGLVSAVCFAEKGHRVICVDNNEEKINLLKQGISPIYEPGLDELIHQNLRENRVEFTLDFSYGIKNSDVIFIAVGTPSLPNGEADLSQVKTVAQKIAQEMNGPKIIVNKSTVPVGTGELVKQIVLECRIEEIPFDVVSNPEFLREGCAIKDTMQPDRIIIGANSPQSGRTIADLHKEFSVPVLVTDIRTAEMIKYASNAFLATKISFINEIANICEKVGADVTKVAQGMGLDKRIGSQFLKAGLGYGGSCFPKDTKALIQIAGNANHDFELLKSVVKVNQSQRHKVIQKLKAFLGDLQGRTVGILGLAFKPNTDDLRDAPSIEIISYLKMAGVKVKAYDPIAMEQAKKIVKGIEFVSDPYQAIENADAVILVTEWEEFNGLDLKKVKEIMKVPCFIDGRNFFEPELMHEIGFQYFSIGRSPRDSVLEEAFFAEAAVTLEQEL